MITKPYETVQEQNSGKGDVVQDAGMVFRPIPLGPPIVPTTLGPSSPTLSPPRPVRPVVSKPIILVPDQIGQTYGVDRFKRSK